MYHVACWQNREAERQRYAEQITLFCEAKGLFPQVMQYDDQECFFETAQKDAPTNAVIVPEWQDLNAARHLRLASYAPRADDLCSDLVLLFTPSGCGQTISCWSRFRKSIGEDWNAWIE